MKETLSLSDYLSKFLYSLLRPFLNHVEKDEAIAFESFVYGRAQMRHFNCFHRFLFQRFFRKIRVEAEDINRLKTTAAHGTLVYAMPHIGQLEEQFLNHMHLTHGLPLSKYANGLSQIIWMKWKHLTQLLKRRGDLIQSVGTIPDPLESGLLEKMLKEGEEIGIRIKTSRLYDDLLWFSADEDPLLAIVRAAKEHAPIYIVTEQFLWDRRPERGGKSWIDILFGERTEPGLLRRLWLFCSRYRKQATVKIGSPISVRDFIENQGDIDDTKAVIRLRKMLLESFSLERKKITGPALKPRSWMIQQIMESERVQKSTYELAIEKKKDPERIKLLAQKYAREIAANISYYYVEIFQRLVGWILNTIYDDIEIDTEGLEALQKTVPHHPVVLVPCHRSHMDYLLLSTILYQHGIAVPFVASGINLSIWPLGHIFRRLGAFFMRRTFAGNPLYRAVFQSYLDLLISEKFCQEFFIEGGRSRTGKLRQPRMGMLSMITDSMKNHVSNELIFCPVAITYDQVIETKSYADELAGATKSMEKTRDILKLGKFLKRKYGRIYIRFGKNISFMETATEVLHDPSRLSEISKAEKNKIVEKIAYQIMSEINKETLVTPTALAASALLNHTEAGITRDSLMRSAQPMLEYLTWLDAPVSNLIEAHFEESLKDALEKFSSQKLIISHTDFTPPFYELDHSKRMLLDYSKNSSIHFFLPLSLIARIFCMKAETSASMEEISSMYHEMILLLRIEFVSGTGLHHSEERMVRRTLQFMKEQEWIEEGSTLRYTSNPSKLWAIRTVAHLTTNYMEGYLAALLAGEAILSGKQAPKSERELMRQMIRYCEKLGLLGFITRPEAISKELFKNALDRFIEMGILLKNPSKEENRLDLSLSSEPLSVLSKVKVKLHQWSSLS